MVKRYDPIGKGEITPVDDGPFVDYADYVALQAECERLRKELRNRGARNDTLWSHGEIIPGLYVESELAFGRYLCKVTDKSYVTHRRPSKVEE